MSAPYLVHLTAAATAADDGPNWGLRLTLVGALLVGYLVSLHKNPWRKCHACGGKPGRSGWFFWWSRGQCGCCNGTGRHLRWGRYLVFGDPSGAPLRGRR